MRMLRHRIDTAEEAAVAWGSTHIVPVLRVALGLVIVWVGLNRLCPELCDVELLADQVWQAFAAALLPLKAFVWLLVAVEAVLVATVLRRPMEQRRRGGPAF